MQQSPITTYADITEVRKGTGTGTCNQLLAEGRVLLGVYPLTTAEEQAQRKSRKRQQERNPKDTTRYVQRVVGHVTGRRLE
jgi:hypothetical protein